MVLAAVEADATDEPRARRGDGGRDGAPRPPARPRAGERAPARGAVDAPAGDPGPHRHQPAALRAARPRRGRRADRREPPLPAGRRLRGRVPARRRLREPARDGGGARPLGADRGLAAGARDRIGGGRARHARATHRHERGRPRRHADGHPRGPARAHGRGARPRHPRGAAAHAGSAHRRARGAHRDRDRLRHARGAARGGPGRPGRDHPRARPALRGGGAAPARGGGAGRPRPHDRRRARARHRASPGHRGRAGAVPQRRRGDRPAHPRVRRGPPALLDVPVVRRARRDPGRARPGTRRPGARGAPAPAHERLSARHPHQPPLHGAGPAAGHPGPDGGADPDRRPDRGPALRGQPLGPHLHRPARIGAGAARRAGRHRDPQRPDPGGRADRPRHRGAAGPRAAGEPGSLPVRGARHQRRGVGLGSRQRRAVVERGREHALRLHAGAGRPGRRVVVREYPSGRSRPREARHQRSGGARGGELERGVSLPPGRRNVRLRLRPGLRAARRGRPGLAHDRRDDGHHPALRARGRAPAGPEDGGGGPPRGRRRARLQQPAHDHHRPHPPGARPAQGRRPGAAQRGGDPEDGGPRRRPHAPAPGLQPQAGAPAEGPRPQRDGRGREHDAPAAHRRGRGPAAHPGAGRGAGERRSGPARAGADEPGGERARRDARGRHARPRDRPRAARRGAARSAGSAPARPVRGAPGDGHRHRHGRRDAGPHLRTVLHHQGAGEGHRPRALDGARDRAPARRRDPRAQRGGRRHDLRDLPAPGGDRGRHRRRRRRRGAAARDRPGDHPAGGGRIGRARARPRGAGAAGLHGAGGERRRPGRRGLREGKRPDRHDPHRRRDAAHERPRDGGSRAGEPARHARAVHVGLHRRRHRPPRRARREHAAARQAVHARRPDRQGPRSPRPDSSEGGCAPSTVVARLRRTPSRLPP